MMMTMMISPIFFPLYNLKTRIICARLTITASHKTILLLQSEDHHDDDHDQNDDHDDDEIYECYRLSQDDPPAQMRMIMIIMIIKITFIIMILRVNHDGTPMIHHHYP